MGHDLDHLGITVCSVAGTNFMPYVKFLTALGLPFSIITDWDPREKGTALGFNRSWRLVGTMEGLRTGRSPRKLIDDLKALGDSDEFCERCETHGVFLNMHTLEIDLFKDEDFTQSLIDTLREVPWSQERKGWIDGWEEDPETLDVDNYLKLIEVVGKGRFAQRLASRIEGTAPPDYIAGAISHVVDRV